MYALVYSPNGIVCDECEVALFDTLEAARESMFWQVDALVQQRDEGYDDYGVGETHAYMDGNCGDGAEWQIVEAFGG